MKPDTKEEILEKIRNAKSERALKALLIALQHEGLEYDLNLEAKETEFEK